MAWRSYNNGGIGFVCVCVVVISVVVSGRPTTFLEDFRVTWADSHVKELDGGRGIQLLLDRSSGKMVLFIFRILALALHFYVFLFFFLFSSNFESNKFC